MTYADVAVFDVGDPWSPILTYAIDSLSPVDVGSVVTLPWGRKEVLGVVLRMHNEAPTFQTKSIAGKLYNLPIPQHLLQTATWMSAYYHEPLQRCVETVILCKKAMKRVTTSRIASRMQLVNDKKLTLTTDQQHAVDMVLSSTNTYTPFLLHGVTGSGKTEVYMTVMEEVLKAEKEIIYLIPEIGLTPQTLHRIRSRFGEGVRVVNSTLSDGERFRLVQDIESGAAKIVVGSRSALFTPFHNLGLIVIDESHDGSYKQDATPHYSTVATAEQICRTLNIPLILGSATPTVEQHYHSHDRYTLLSLPARANEALLPTVQVADMREELKKRNFSTVSECLEKCLRNTLAHGEQAVLFINRRGYSSAFVCRACGWRATCPRCSVALVYHRAYSGQANVLVCHQCEHMERLPAECGACGSLLVKPMGSGTEKVVDDVQKLFPSARIVRMDKDTTSRKGAHDEIYQGFVNGKFDILVGTQMVTKGWDIAGVTCVGIMNADSLLHMPMYDAAEHAFELITQVAGRAGRSKELAGTVVIQTYSPEHYAVESAKNHDYYSFYEQELTFRKMLRYPPYSSLALLTVSHKKLADAKRKADELCEKLQNELTRVRESGIIEGRCEILGPHEAPIHRVNEIYYYQMTLKGEKTIIDALLELVPHEWSVSVDI